MVRMMKAKKSCRRSRAYCGGFLLFLVVGWFAEHCKGKANTECIVIYIYIQCIIFVPI